MHSPEDIELIRLKPGEPVDVDIYTLQLRPTKIYVLPTGSKNNTPSYVFLMDRGPGGMKAVAQISNHMLQEVLGRNRLSIAQNALMEIYQNSGSNNGCAAGCGHTAEVALKEMGLI